MGRGRERNTKDERPLSVLARTAAENTNTLLQESKTQRRARAVIYRSNSFQPRQMLCFNVREREGSRPGWDVPNGPKSSPHGETPGFLELYPPLGAT